MTFKYGFEINGLKYGWHNKNLYRLPTAKDGRYYGLRKMRQVIVGNNPGYRVAQKAKSIEQLQGMTTELTPVVKIAKDKSIPGELTA